MTTLAQMLHVARKDLRECRWPFVVYAALVVFAAVRAAGLWSPSRALEMAMFLVVIAGLVLVAMLVQSDSPIRADAFWATRPLAPSAVLVAKIVVAVVIVVGLAIAGQAYAIASFDIHGAALARSLVASAGEYGRWLLVGLALASLTKDVKTFVIAFVCIPVVIGVGSDLWTSMFSNEVTFDASRRVSRISMESVIAWLGVVGCLAVPFWLYAKRDRGWRALAGGTGAVVCGLFGALNADSSTTVHERSSETPRNAIEISIPKNAPINLNDIRLEVRATSSLEGHRLTLSEPYAELLLGDGQTLRLAVNPPIAELRSTRPAIGDNAWLIPNRDSAYIQAIFLRPDITQQPLLAKGIKRITIFARISASTPHIVGSLPLSANGRLASPGRRLSVESWRKASGQAEVRLNAIEIPVPGVELLPPLGAGSRVLSYALVNDARHEAVPLTVRASSNGSTHLVLPGEGVFATSFTLDTRDAFPGQTTPVDDSWYVGARLWLIDWLPAGSYPVRAELTLPQPGRNDR
jgi:hypothetical protein